VNFLVLLIWLWGEEIAGVTLLAIILEYDLNVSYFVDLQAADLL
jgi:hypothetical protein